MSDRQLHKTTAGGFTRLSEGAADAQVRYTYSKRWPLEKPLFPSVLRVNRAWVVMLAERGLLGSGKAAAIVGVLDEIEEAGADAFPVDPRNGDVYLNIQSYVIERLGPEVGGYIYMGRGRPDSDATTLRIFVRDRLLDVAAETIELVAVLTDAAERHAGTIMPGYTGSQSAQPWTLGHYYASFADALARDLERLQQAYARANKSFLGAGTGAGSALELDRDLTASLLGCDGLIENSREFVTSYDAVLETAAACSILLTHVSQLTSDLDTWSTQEFGVVQLTDRMSGSSTFMPQKKNPVPFTTIRSVANASIGYLPALLGVMRTHSWDFDRVGTIGPIIALLEETEDTVAYMRLTLESVVVDEQLMRERTLAQWTTATEIASLVQKTAELDWRTAHWITERFMRSALEAGLSPTEVTGDLLDDAAVAITGEAVGVETAALRRALDPDTFVRTRRTRGSVNPEEVRRMVADRRRVVAEARKWEAERRTAIEAAEERLRALVEKIGATV